MSKPVVVRGQLGWSNDHATSSSLDVYGPDGRWGGRPRYTQGGTVETQGDKLADALAEAGAGEGADFVVVAVNRFGDLSLLDEVERFVTERMEVIHRCPPKGMTTMPCCGKTPFEVPRYHRITLDESAVTCGAG